jgi:hypothetical protein
MTQYKKTLIVEGNEDKRFFHQMLKHLQLRNVGLEPKKIEDVFFHPQTPKDLGAGASNKDNALKVLEAQLTFLRDSSKTHLALVLDADKKGIHRGGWEATLQCVADKIAPYGFKALPEGSLTEGFVFHHPDTALKPFGLWIMADSNGEGAFEDWFIPALQQHDVVIYEHVRRSVGGIPDQRFGDADRGKAEITTWRAWQKQVGYFDLEKINLNVSPMLPLIQWLQHIYQ